MIKALKENIIINCLLALALVGDVGVTARCRGWYYEPKMPEELAQKNSTKS